MLMKKHILLLCCFICVSVCSLRANCIDSLELLLRTQPTLEKIYIHTDNQSYFVGDTLWYKAYVLRSDNLKPTDISKILYIELLTPDGYLVERHRLVIDEDSGCFGQFILPDSIYSGYYELRAYTRWQLNFNVKERSFSSKDALCFFNKEMANDYYRSNEGLYSRVFPIYEKPKMSGNYDDRWIRPRPLRNPTLEASGLKVQFYPEGGAIVAGIKNRIAFEILDLNGKPLSLTGELSNGSRVVSNEDGRGEISVLPAEGEELKANFEYQGIDYSFNLPKVIPIGVVFDYDIYSDSLYIHSKGVQLGAISITCRGSLCYFGKIEADTVINASELPTGVNEIVVYDNAATPLAVRQIFINHHDCEKKLLVSNGNGAISAPCFVEPFQLIPFQISTEQDSLLPDLSVSVSDDRGDKATYNDGNILTELLLAGDLRGFVAHPDYYFESDDAEHKSRLNLLLLIQGWSKYEPISSIKFDPERDFRMEGKVYKIDVRYKTSDFLDLVYNNCSEKYKTNPCFFVDPYSFSLKNDVTKLKNKDSIKSIDILLEAEIDKGSDLASIKCPLDSSMSFSFKVPSFYEEASFFMTAYRNQDSTRFCLDSKMDAHKFNPLYSPYFYIQRSSFYPHFTEPYSWFQTHEPEDGIDINSYEADHILDNVVVKSRRRQKIFNQSKPAMILDFLDELNSVMDDGLYWGPFNCIYIWEQISRSLFGNMNNPDLPIKIRASVDGHDFLKKYEANTVFGIGSRMTPVALQNKLLPSHIDKIKVYTDYNMRDGTGKYEGDNAPDIWFEVIPFPDQVQRPIWRDRMFHLDGFPRPRQFYHRDYSKCEPDSTDYRRTLYWNPNVHPDKDGKVNVTFYNGARPAYLKVSICGIGADGKIYYY